MQARHLVISGKVQGVGFRPFIYRLAHSLQLTGWVRNYTGQVEVHVQGSVSAIDQFCSQVINSAPAISLPEIISIAAIDIEPFADFRILKSEQSDNPQIHIPADFFTCADCLAELRDPGERRHHYPFINCTQCGPRYTIIKDLPYDRPATSMADFTLCKACRAEYENPLDRRFHAQPLACGECGPHLHFHVGEQHINDSTSALAAATQALLDGKIIAAKGIGGYHLLCDAQNNEAIGQLRRQKPRADKPLAIMFPERGNNGLAAVCEHVVLTPEEAELLHSPARPIVVARNNTQGLLSALIAPGLQETGVMLPYSPLHYLLLDALDKPVVATSANISGEPVLTDQTEVEQRLSHVTQGFLHHDRDIVRPADDPVYRTIAGKPRPLRMGRGNAPVEIQLPFSLPEAVLATGAQMKNTVALAWDNRLVVSPHIGDLDSIRSQRVFNQVIEDLQQLYQVTAKAVVCDAHPGYASSHWAKKSGLPCTPVFHHFAHASALRLEHKDSWDSSDWLVFTWDGVGYGADSTLWGGEALLGRAGNWQRVASMLPFHLPGGEKAGREPWRSAAALCWQAGIEWNGLPDGADLLRQAWEKRLNSPQTTAVGRLFDAAAALTGLLQQASYEGQGPMLLEQACNVLQPCSALPQIVSQQGLLQADWTELLPVLLDATCSIAERASYFHSCLAHTLVHQALQIRERHGIRTIGLCGGVFQNRILTDYAVRLLEEHDFSVCLSQSLPANDASISAGQIIETTAAKNA